MGVFARIFGRSKATAEASAAETHDGVEPEGAEAEGTEPAAQEAASAEAKGTAGDGPEEVAARSDAGTDETSEGSGIPKQQSAEEAADSAAGEGARR
ncbi:hypothetical protein A6P39_013055 [Streptomyces sp. FXJ1.172]|uniref:hypothetical protein n=1 Tax=Streptomyces sp. FXJ1.172 TaxID=710705 RepID=UPI00083102E6|nr:hypothetical protein [Streptomyces sp. FXJ1.172]WEO94865.1 hypothetical protein A6P39_013055 [Streptomyces sp. FXJ1.172]